MEKKEGAKPKLLRYFLEHVGEIIPRSALEELCKDNGTEWARSLRSLRDDGWEINYDKSKNTYYFPYSTPQNEAKDSRYISKKLAAMVMLRDNSTCQMCGKNVKDDHVRLHIDHVIPHEWGGKTELDNLQCLCSECNEGKKNWATGEPQELMVEISKATSTSERLKKYFEYYANQEIDVDKLAVIGKSREWTRQLRYVRADYDMNIKYLPHNKSEGREKDSYIYIKDNQ